jgi:hypothetical protein
MFYEPESGVLPAPLTHNPFPALVAPRPIAWITTLGADGTAVTSPRIRTTTSCRLTLRW